MKTLAAILTIGLLASNMAWMHGYRQLHDDWAQSTTILGERDAYIGALPDSSVYQLSTVNGELQAHCANGGGCHNPAKQGIRDYWSELRPVAQRCY